MLQQAVDFYNKGKFGEARKIYRHILSNGVDGKAKAEALNGHALCELAVGNTNIAYDNLKEAIEIDSENWQYKLHMAQAALRLTEPLGRYKYEAIDNAREAAKASNDPRVWVVYANTCKHFDRYIDALLGLEKLSQLDPKNVSVYLNKADIYTRLERYDEAKACYLKAIELDPENPDAHALLSAVYAKEEGNPEACLYHAEKGIKSPSRSLICQWHVGLCQLAMGNHKQGWKNYETRLKIGNYLMKEIAQVAARFPDKPFWNLSLKGRVLIHPEQGFGDTLQFCRYVKLVQGLGNEVIFETHAQMRTLMANSFPGVTVLPKSADFPGTEGLPDFDYQIPLMSLPAALETTLETIPAETPYIRAEPSKIAKWGKKIASLPGLKVGICWAGENRPHDQAMYFHNQTRSMPLQEFEDILHMKGVSFVSLQMGRPGLESKKHPMVHDFTSDIWEFSDTAGIIHHLDLVISVCTSVAHLAGGMGKPLWVLNKKNPCWRWMIDQKTSPWYPGSRLFQQKEKGDWKSVADMVKKELAIHAGT